MTGLEILLMASLLALGVLFSWLFWHAGQLCLIARSESDVNGDPERDAGVDWPPPPEDELARMSAAWDRGSVATSKDAALRARLRAGETLLLVGQIQHQHSMEVSHGRNVQGRTH